MSKDVNAAVVYTYDSLHRLSAVDYGNGLVINYTYDAAGNRLSQVVSCIAPTITSPLSATITSTEASLGGNITADGGGAITARGVALSVSATNSGPQIGGTGVTNVTTTGTTGVFTVNVTTLLPATAYSFAAYATNSAGTTYTSVGTFTTLSNDATLSGLTLSTGTLVPTFASGTMSYSVAVPHASTSITVTPAVTQAQATVEVNGVAVTPGNASAPISLNSGSNAITAVVTAQDGTTTKTYTVTVTRGLLLATYDSAIDVPVTANGYTATGNALNFSLNYAPATGTNLTVVNNTGLGFIQGTFNNLTQGQIVPLTFNGVTYTFVANYYGGTGNDLVLQWRNTRIMGWGGGGEGELGNNSTADSLVPVAVNMSGGLVGKTVIAVAAGMYHSLALCSDGTVFGWGNNANGQLGNNSTADSLMPVAVDMSGELSGKTVIAIAAGAYDSLALCSDGTVVGWGDNGVTYSRVPVMVDRNGVLAGKTVIGIAAGAAHSLALCSDGTVAAWGLNSYGQLGNNSTTFSAVPEAVSTSGALAGKTVIAIAAGAGHSVALCSDGTLVAWGLNASGSLGNHNTTDSAVPVLVDTTGVLSGKAIVSMAAGGFHNLALCSDGTLAAWGNNWDGELGNNTTTESPVSVPVAVDIGGVLSGKTLTKLSAGRIHSLVLCMDGSLFSWGFNDQGQLGNNSTTQNTVPGAVNSASLGVGELFIQTAGGPDARHTLAVVASPPAPAVTTLAASSVTRTTATLNGTVNANNNATDVSFDYGTSVSYGVHVPGTPTSVTGSTASTVSVSLTALSPGTTYHFRLNGTSAAGSSGGTDMTFTTLSTSDIWRLQYFGTLSSNETTSDTADPNHNGINNLLEYALGGDPTGNTADTGILPQASPDGSGHLQLAFSHYLDRNDITLTVQASDELTGTWTDLARSVNGGTFTVIAAGASVSETGTGNVRLVTVGDQYLITDPAHPHRFMRLQVSH